MGLGLTVRGRWIRACQLLETLRQATVERRDGPSWLRDDDDDGRQDVGVLMHGRRCHLQFGESSEDGTLLNCLTLGSQSAYFGAFSSTSDEHTIDEIF